MMKYMTNAATYLKSSISGVRSWISLDESRNAAEPEALMGALLPMTVPTAMDKICIIFQMISNENILVFNSA